MFGGVVVVELLGFGGIISGLVMVDIGVGSSADCAALPSRARVVIVGGGVMGCALAYHLAKGGWQDVVLLEKAELTSGSTWHAAGQATYANAHYALAQCAKYSINLYQTLQEETGQSVTWHGCGSLKMAYNDDERDYLHHIASVCAAGGLRAEVIPPQHIGKLHPLYNTDGICAALHTPDDGHLDPAGAAFALAKGAKQRGATIIRRCRVLGIERQPNGEWMAKTEKGDITCEHLVNAGGMYARQIALWSGYDLPTTSVTHHYLITEPSPEFSALPFEPPVVRDDREISGYARMEQKSVLIGIYEKQNANAVWVDGAPWDAENVLFDPQLERIMPWPESALARMPVLAKLGIRRIVHGAISHPPDGNPLVGPAPGLPNYWCFCGCQIGIGWGPGLALELARWMIHGAADISMRDLDPRRFGRYATSAYQVAKGKEDYNLRHETPFPHFNRLAARPQRTSPLYERLKAKGAVYEEVCGWERPRWFAPKGIAALDVYSFRRTMVDTIVADEVRAVREKVGVCDISAFAKVEVLFDDDGNNGGNKGADALSQLIANSLPNVGRVKLAHFLTANGRLELEATIAQPQAGRFYIVCAAFFELRLLDILAGIKGAKIINRSDEWAAIAVNGPLSPEVLPDDAAAMEWLGVKTITIGGGDVLSLRLSYAGESGWELHGGQDVIAEVYDSIIAKGGKCGIADYGSFAADSMRMEKKYPGAAELTNEVMLHELGIKATNPRAAATAAAKWHCVYLLVADGGDCDGIGGESVFADGECVGMITSIARGHHTGKLLAFAFVSPAAAKVGGELQVNILGEMRAARVLPEAAYDPQNTKPRGIA